MRGLNLAQLRRYRFWLGGAGAAVVLVVLSFMVRGPSVPTDPVATTGQGWPDELVAPSRIIAHRISGRAAPPSKSDPQIRSFEGWASLERIEFAPGSPEGRALAKLFATGKFVRTLEHEPPCAFNGEFGLEFIAPKGRRTAVFSFACNKVAGDSGIKTFDDRALGAYASSLFPKEPAYQRAVQAE